MTTTEHLACACALLTRRCAALRVERDDARGREEAQRLRVIDVENEQLNGDSALRKENAELIQNAVVANYNRDKALAKLAEAERRLAEGTAFTYCAYCGMKFAADGEHATDDVSQHICTCHKHPMRQVEAQRDAEKARADANKDAWYKCADRANAAEREVERLRGEVDKAYARAPFDAAKLKAEVERLRGMLLDAIRYVESEYGARGELCGSAVNGQTYLEWVRATQREADAPPADAPNGVGERPLPAGDKA